jgi:hypothetical protein
MTEFHQETRHYCRNRRCRMKLPAPVTNDREAFCTRGCHTSFYLHRCLVCESAIERKRDDQKICRKAQCRSAWRAGSGFGRYVASSCAQSASEKPVNKGAKQALGPDRDIAWAIAVNGARIRAPRWVLDKAFGGVPLIPAAAEPEGVAA